MYKEISLDNGKYTVVYDETGTYPEKVLRYDEEWFNAAGDNVIFWLCAEIEKLKQENKSLQLRVDNLVYERFYNDK